MKKFFAILLIISVISFNIFATECESGKISKPKQIINVNNEQQVKNFKLFNEENDDIILPEYLAGEKEPWVAVSSNTQESQNLMFKFLDQKYRQLKAQENPNLFDAEQDLLSIRLDFILSLLDHLADQAKESGNSKLYNLIQNKYFKQLS